MVQMRVAVRLRMGGHLRTLALAIEVKHDMLQKQML